MTPFLLLLRQFLMLAILGGLLLVGPARAEDRPPAPMPAPAQAPAVCGELGMAQAAVKRAEQAADERRWPAALADWDMAENGLRDAINRCPAQAEAARAALSPIAARKLEAENGIHATVCQPAISKAFALDNRAAKLQLEKKDWLEIERLFGQAEAAWGEAAFACKDDSRTLALANKADSARARSKAATFLGDGAYCDPAFADAGRMADLAKGAWNERQWEDAGIWYRKAEFAWGLAAEKCRGHKREQALKKKESAGVDAHNAAYCAPHWDRATELSGKLKQLPAAEMGEERANLHLQVEIAWDEAAAACRGAPQDKARANVAALARQRGGVPPSVAAPRRQQQATAGSPPVQTSPAPAEVPVEVVAAAPAAVPAAVPVSAPVYAPVPHAAPPVAAAPAQIAVAPAAAPVGTPRVADLPSPPRAPPGEVAQPPSQPPLSAPAEVRVATQPQAAASPPAAAGGEPLPVVSLRAGDTSFSGRFRLDPSRQTLSGVGRVKWDNGNVFDGTLVSGKAEGKGSMSWANGDRFEGEWKNDLQHGTGRMSYANGDHYEGQFSAGYPEGRGRYVFSPSGDRYEGQVRRGKPDGQGSYFWKNGDRFDGAWRNGQKNGPGRYTWAGGQSQEGQYVDDQRVP